MLTVVLPGVLLLAAGLVLSGVAGLPERAPPRLGDVPAAGFAAPPEALRVVVLGTSLSARADWPQALAAGLERCLARPVSLGVVAAPGQTSHWGVAQLPQVLAARPDVVVVEFTANDADARDGLSLEDSRRTHETILAALRAEAPERRVILMSMNPTHGLRGALRWRHGAYRAIYRTLAEEDPAVGYLDLDARWRQQMTWRQRLGAIPDGLHPRPEAARAVIVGPLTAKLAGVFGQDCPG